MTPVSLSTLTEQRELARAALGDDYADESDRYAELFDAASAVFARAEQTVAPLDVVGHVLAQGRVRGVTRGNLVVMAAAARDWLDAQERQAEANAPALDLGQWTGFEREAS